MIIRNMNGRMEDMENTLKYDYLIERLRSGEIVKCKSCGKGIYRPMGEKDGLCYNYDCDECGAHIIIEPMIEVK